MIVVDLEVEVLGRGTYLMELDRVGAFPRVEVDASPKRDPPALASQCLPSPPALASTIAKAVLAVDLQHLVSSKSASYATSLLLRVISGVETIPAVYERPYRYAGTTK